MPVSQRAGVVERVMADAPTGRGSPPRPRLDFAALPARRRYSVVRPRTRRRTRAQRRLFWQRTAILAALGALAAVVLGLALAGSPSRLAHGGRVAGVDVRGKTAPPARSDPHRHVDA